MVDNTLETLKRELYLGDTLNQRNLSGSYLKKVAKTLNFKTYDLKSISTIDVAISMPGFLESEINYFVDFMSGNKYVVEKFHKKPYDEKRQSNSRFYPHHLDVRIDDLLGYESRRKQSSPKMDLSFGVDLFEHRRLDKILDKHKKIIIKNPEIIVVTSKADRRLPDLILNDFKITKS